MPNTTEGKVTNHPADPLGLTGPELDDANLYDEQGMNPIDKWLGRPGHIWVQSITRGSPAAECGLIEEGDLLVGVRVKGSEELDMASWSLRNALELIVGEPGEPVQLMLQRSWTNASVARLKARRKKWKDDLNDDPDVSLLAKPISSFCVFRNSGCKALFSLRVEKTLQQGYSETFVARFSFSEYACRPKPLMQGFVLVRRPLSGELRH